MHIRLAVFSFVFAISGCASIPHDVGAEARGVDGEMCMGRVAPPASGFLETSNPSLLAKAALPITKGGVCAAKVFAVLEPVVLYRVFDANNPYSKFGNWWSLQHPSGTKEDYRAANAICKEWSALDRVIACEVRPGTQVVIGTTQSAQCSDGAIYTQTAINQVFVPNDGVLGIIHVGKCSQEAAWPQ